jgi:hypothetical protein
VGGGGGVRRKGKNKLVKVPLKLNVKWKYSYTCVCIYIYIYIYICSESIKTVSATRSLNYDKTDYENVYGDYWANFSYCSHQPQASSSQSVYQHYFLVLLLMVI